MPTVTNRPGAANFTDNENYYVIVASFTNANQKLQVRVFVDDGVTPKQILLYPPYLNAIVRFSINDVVKPYTSFQRPGITDALISTIQPAFLHTVRAWIDCRVFDPTASTNPAFESDSAFPRRYIKGGYGLWANAPNFDFEDKRKWFFTWQPSDKLVGQTEPNWLLYCHPFGLVADLQYTMYYTDGTEESIKTPLVETNNIPAQRQFDQFFIPTGVEQCSLQAVNPSKTIHKYRVRVLDRVNETVFAEYWYRVDYRPNYDAFVVYYRNSLGGWDSLRILGHWEENNNYARKEYRRVINPNYALFTTDLNGASPVFDVEEKRRWKANTGHLSKHELDSLRDLMLTKEMAIIKNKVWIPVVMTSETLEGLSTKDSLHNVPIEFQSAYENHNYTPDILPWQR